MLRKSVVVLCVGLALVGRSRPTYAESLLVAPAGYEDLEGNIRLLNLPPPPGGVRIQWVHPASHFLDLPEYLDTITSVSWRPDQTVTGSHTAVFSHMELRLSTTNASPGNLSSKFTNNVGSDETVVYSGPITFETDGNGPQHGPRSFDYLIDFQTPFLFDPSDGNLLLDYTFRPPVDGRPNVDAQASQPAPAMISGRGPGAAYIVTQFGFHAADYNGDGQLSGADIDLLSAGVGGSNTLFDLDGNGVVEAEDRRIWVEEVFGTAFGDANLDKEVTFADFLALSDTLAEPGGWAQGDFDGSGDVLFADFLLLSANFGKSFNTVSAVPEPSAAWLCVLGLVSFIRRRASNL